MREFYVSCFWKPLGWARQAQTSVFPTERPELLGTMSCPGQRKRFRLFSHKKLNGDLGAGIESFQDGGPESQSEAGSWCR